MWNDVNFQLGGRIRNHLNIAEKWLICLVMVLHIFKIVYGVALTGVLPEIVANIYNSS